MKLPFFLAGALIFSVSCHKEDEVQVCFESSFSQSPCPFADSCSGSGVMFLNCTENVMEQHWDFGDGETSDSPNPFHEYHQAGTFKATLKIISTQGKSGMISKDVEIKSYSTQCSCSFHKYPYDPPHTVQTFSGRLEDVMEFRQNFNNWCYNLGPNQRAICTP